MVIDVKKKRMGFDSTYRKLADTALETVDGDVLVSKGRVAMPRTATSFRRPQCCRGEKQCRHDCCRGGERNAAFRE